MRIYRIKAKNRPHSYRHTAFISAKEFELLSKYGNTFELIEEEPGKLVLKPVKKPVKRRRTK